MRRRDRMRALSYGMTWATTLDRIETVTQIGSIRLNRLQQVVWLDWRALQSHKVIQLLQNRTSCVLFRHFSPIEGGRAPGTKSQSNTYNAALYGKLGFPGTAIVIASGKCSLKCFQVCFCTGP